MEMIVLFACIVVAVALAGENLLGLLVAFAACQFLGALAWTLGTAHRGRARLRVD